MELRTLANEKFSLGRAAVFACPWWDGTSDLFDDANPDRFVHVGTTEGENNPEPNTEFSILTLPEHTGPAPVEALVAGEALTRSFSMYPTVAGLRMFSPTGSASAGSSYSQPVRELTFWIVPELLFRKLDPSTNLYHTVDVLYEAGQWTKDGQAFSTEDQRLFDFGYFHWRVYADRLMAVKKFEEGGKSLSQVTIHEMVDFTKPEGHMLRTVGFDLATSGIDLEGFIS